jgi:putative CocE/NonD family hydrolase
VGGLFDAEDCYGAWNCFKATSTQSPQTNNKIVMGPWYHGQWSREGNFLGNIRFESNTSDYFQKNLEVPFFQYHLKNKGTEDNIAKANIFFTGENQWKKFDQWPPSNIENKNLLITSKEKLGFEIGKSTNPLPFYSEYISDPAKPVPYTEDVHNKRTREYMTDDQRFASRRTDVLTYEMDELKEDLTLAGPVIAHIQTSISTTDADFVVKLIDVFPYDFSYPSNSIGNNNNYLMGGYQMLVRGEIMRGKYRNSFEKPEAFTPNKPTPVSFALPDVAHTFKKGHRLMIQIQSTWFPLADRNPQKFTNIYTADNSDFQKATIRIYGGANATYFTIPILKSL